MQAMWHRRKAAALRIFLFIPSTRSGGGAERCLLVAHLVAEICPLQHKKRKCRCRCRDRVEKVSRQLRLRCNRMDESIIRHVVWCNITSVLWVPSPSCSGEGMSLHSITCCRLRSVYFHVTTTTPAGKRHTVQQTADINRLSRR